jgi:hypothetical protein
MPSLTIQAAPLVPLLAAAVEMAVAPLDELALSMYRKASAESKH